MEFWDTFLTVTEVSFESLPQLALQVPIKFGFFSYDHMNALHKFTFYNECIPMVSCVNAKCPQVYIVLQSVRPGWAGPGWWQLFTISSSFASGAMGPTKEFLVARQEVLVKKNRATKLYTKLTKTEKLPDMLSECTESRLTSPEFYPFFLFLLITRVGTIAFTFAALNYRALAIYPPVYPTRYTRKM